MFLSHLSIAFNTSFLCIIYFCAHLSITECLCKTTGLTLLILVFQLQAKTLQNFPKSLEFSWFYATVSSLQMMLESSLMPHWKWNIFFFFHIILSTYLYNCTTPLNQSELFRFAETFSLICTVLPNKSWKNKIHFWAFYSQLNYLIRWR